MDAQSVPIGGKVLTGCTSDIHIAGHRHALATMGAAPRRLKGRAMSQQVKQIHEHMDRAQASWVAFHPEHLLTMSIHVLSLSPGTSTALH